MVFIKSFQTSGCIYDITLLYLDNFIIIFFLPKIMLAVYSELKNAQKVKELLLKKKVLHGDYLPVKELNHIYFPIIKKIKIAKAKIVNTEFSFPKKQNKESIENILKKKLTKKELSILPRSQEMVGKILILEIPDKLIKKEKIIAQAYLQLNSNITTVVRKSAIHAGEYRTRKVKLLAGKRTKETIHQENNIKIKLNLEKTYFSARSANERMRITKQVKKNELVLVMFSGAAPFPLVIAKNSSAKKVYGIELNLMAHQYALENVVLNKLEDKIIILSGDVRKVVPKLKNKFERIVMPLPKTGEDFLDVALLKAKKDTIIHLYAFLHETKFAQHSKKIKRIVEKNKRKIRIMKKVKCGQFSPGTFRVCFDLKVLS
jgi:tRNA (guanine37-N1)-methyltransferase